MIVELAIAATWTAGGYVYFLKVRSEFMSLGRWTRGARRAVVCASLWWPMGLLMDVAGGKVADLLFRWFEDERPVGSPNAKRKETK